MLWNAFKHMFRKLKLPMYLNSIAQLDEITAFKLFFKMDWNNKEGISIYTNKRCACVKRWRGLSLKMSYMAIEKIWFGFLYIFCGCVSPRSCHCHQKMFTIFGVWFISWNKYTHIVYSDFECIKNIWLQRTISLSTMEWLLLFKPNWFIHTHAHVQCSRPKKPWV